MALKIEVKLCMLSSGQHATNNYQRQANQDSGGDWF
jgi:hypothetical protein